MVAKFPPEDCLKTVPPHSLLWYLPFGQYDNSLQTQSLLSFGAHSSNSSSSVLTISQVPSLRVNQNYRVVDEERETLRNPQPSSSDIIFSLSSKNQRRTKKHQNTTKPITQLLSLKDRIDSEISKSQTPVRANDDPNSLATSTYSRVLDPATSAPNHQLGDFINQPFKKRKVEWSSFDNYPEKQQRIMKKARLLSWCQQQSSSATAAPASSSSSSSSSMPTSTLSNTENQNEIHTRTIDEYHDTYHDMQGKEKEEEGTVTKKRFLSHIVTPSKEFSVAIPSSSNEYLEMLIISPTRFTQLLYDLELSETSIPTVEQILEKYGINEDTIAEIRPWYRNIVENPTSVNRYHLPSFSGQITSYRLDTSQELADASM